MADTNDTTKNDAEQNDSQNKFNEVLNPESTTTQTSDPVLTEKSNETTTITHSHGSKGKDNENLTTNGNKQGKTNEIIPGGEPAGSNQVKTADINSNSNNLVAETVVDTPVNDSKTGATTESNPSTESSKKEQSDNGSGAFSHKQTEEPTTSSTSSNPKTPQTTSHSNIDSDVDDSDQLSDPRISYNRSERDLLENVYKRAVDENLIDRLLGCAYGQALGDAYGLSTEFEDRNDVKRNYPDSSKVIPFPDYVLTGHNRRWKRGDWTDDTDQWILILDTLIYNDADVKVFAKKLTDWIRYGYPELGDHGGMGLGANVSQVVRSYNYLNDPHGSSEAVWERGNRQAAPNGAVMRCSASAFVYFDDLEKVKETTISMCKTTHFDPRCIASCLAVNLAIVYLLTENIKKDDSNAIETLIKRVQKETIDILGDTFLDEHRQLFLWHTDKARTLEELNLDESRSIGYTYKCLASGFYGLRSTRPFKETLNDLIRYGGDADTNGAVCGTMYGARYGYRELPYEWLREMPNKRWLDRKIIDCLNKMNVLKNNAMDTN